MIAYHTVFCVLTICGAAVATNAGPINFLKVLVNKKTSIKGPSQSTLPVGITVAAITVTTTTTGPTRRTMSRDVLVRIVTTSMPEPSTNNENSKEFSNNALIQKMFSANMLTDTRQQSLQEVDDVTMVAGGHVRSTVVDKSGRKLFKKKFPSSQFSKDGVGYDFPAAESGVRYQDPIVAQEISKMDYLTSYPVGKGNYDVGVEEKHYKDWDQPANVWKTIVVGNSVPKSVKNSLDDDDDDGDDDK